VLGSSNTTTMSHTGCLALLRIATAQEGSTTAQLDTNNGNSNGNGNGSKEETESPGGFSCGC